MLEGLFSVCYEGKTPLDALAVQGEEFFFSFESRLDARNRYAPRTTGTAAVAFDLDDAWTVGLVTAREGGRRIGLGVSLGRNNRRIYGEFDFVRDKVLPHGRPSMSALSSWSRRWLNPDRGFVPRPWTGLAGS